MVDDPEIAGDEPVELARNLLGKAIIIADADRVAAAKWAKENFGITAFILDDAFQHRRAKRDLDVVCVDATNPFGNGHILPAGRLRESVNAIERADAIVITRSNEGENIEELKNRLAKFNNSVQIFKASTTNRKFVELNAFHGQAQSKQDDYNGEAVAFAGIANPKSFFRNIKRSGIRLVGECEFEDHFKYTQKNVERIEAIAKATNANCLVTTVKDAVKLGKLEFSMPCYVAEIQTVIDDPDRFRQFVLSV
jgi:tetraacyldisaccharide 4'-kinase